MKQLRAPKKTSSPDYVFIAFVFILIIFGLVMLTSASSDLGKTRFGDSYYYLTHQLIYGLAPGIIGFFAGLFIYYRRFEKWSMVILAISVFSLLLVFTPFGFSVKGSERSLQIGSFIFQPGELLKLTFFIYLAAWISKKKARNESFSEGFIPFIMMTGLIMAILFLQPSTSIALLIFSTAILTYFTAGAKMKFLLSAAIVVTIAVGIVIYVTPYRLQRVMTFLHPSTSNELGSGYHINQALIAIGSGGLTGVGYGQSTTKLKYLPEPIGDSIFAIIGEELGFIGGISFIFIFLLFIWRGLRIAKEAPDSFGRLIIIGFITLIGLQAFVNIAAISGIIPLTGIPLPFISYGGTALVVLLAMCGIIVNISMYRKT